MEDCDKLGGVFDMRYRLEKARTYLADVVNNARDRIYRLGHGVSAKGVENLLKPFSLVPTVVGIFNCTLLKAVLTYP
jgi:hypothetical protein